MSNALSLALSEVMSGKKNEADALIVDITCVVNLMGDAGRLCADAYFCASRTRKYFLAQGTDLSRAAKTLIEDSETDNFLLGKDFGEKLKVAKASEKAGKEMLTSDSSKQPKFKGHYGQPRSGATRNLNFRTPAKIYYSKSTPRTGATKSWTRSSSNNNKSKHSQNHRT